MIDSLLLTNFQVHAKLRIKFGRITSIVGASDAGKSAILRALRFVCLNQIEKGFRRHGTVRTKAKLFIGRHRVCRYRTNGANGYSCDSHVFTALRNQIPSQVNTILNCADVNFQDQHDSPYWFNLSAGQVSRELNSIINLGVIDKTLACIAGALRKARATYDVTEDRLLSAKQARQKLKWTVRCDKELSHLQSLESEAIGLTQKTASLKALVSNALEHRQATKSLKERLAQAENLLRAATRARAFNKKTEGLEFLVSQLRKAERRTTIEVPKTITLDFAMHHRMQLQKIISEIETQEFWKCQAQKQLEKAQRLLQSQKTCPACGHELS